MNCPYCGGTLTLEDLFCPHCGKPNAEGQNHAEDMKKYQDEFSSAKQEVYEKTGRFTGIAVKAVILAILVALSILFLLIASNSYSINDLIRKSRADRKYNEYSKILDSYIEDEDYLGLDAFAESKNLYCSSGKYTKYYSIRRACGNYSLIYEYIFILSSGNEDYIPTYTISSLSDYLTYQYELADQDFSYYDGCDTTENKEIVQKITDRVNLLLKTYLGLSDEELQTFCKASSSRKTIMLEDKLGVTDYED